MRRISMIFAACLVVAFSGAAVAIASSGKDNGGSGGGGTTTTENTTSTNAAKHGQGTFRRSRQILGRVTAVDAVAKKFDLLVSKRQGSIRRGDVLTITTTDATRYKGLTGFDAITVGKSYKVKVRRAIDGTWVAKTVERKRAHRRGGDDNGRGGNDNRRGPHRANDAGVNDHANIHRDDDSENSGRH